MPKDIPNLLLFIGPKMTSLKRKPLIIYYIKNGLQSSEIKFTQQSVILIKTCVIKYKKEAALLETASFILKLFKVD